MKETETLTTQTETQTETGKHDKPSPLRTISRTAYLILAVVLLFAILLQVFLAGAGVLSDPGFLAHHVAFMEWFQTIPVFLLLAALIGRMTRTAKLLPVLIWVAFFLQYQFIGLRPSLAAGLHTVNALLIFWLTSLIVKEGRSAATPLRTHSHESDPPETTAQNPPVSTK